ncbi:hypothetical protein D3C71_23550 [compost metagenome]
MRSALAVRSELEKLLAPQVEAGLQEIRLTVIPGPGITKEAVLAELLASEQAIAEGRVRPLRDPNLPGA